MRLVLCLLFTCLPANAEEPITLTFLANEGFMLQSQGKTVLIDAFVTEPYSIYNAVDAQTWQAILAGTPPYQKVDLALVSHKHRDHFQVDAAVAFLRRHPETRLISSPDVVALLQADPGFDEIKDRVTAVAYQKGRLEHYRDGSLQVEFLPLQHTGERWRDLHNLGHVIRFGQRSVLHVGDAQTDDAVYKPFADQFTNLDIALIPYWFYGSSEGRHLIEMILKPKRVVACHISIEDAAEVAYISNRATRSYALRRTGIEQNLLIRTIRAIDGYRYPSC